MKRSARALRSGMIAGIAGVFSIAFTSTSGAKNLVPLKDAKFDYLCVDLDSIRTEATGWTMFGVTYCSGMHGGQPARVLNYAVSCTEFRASGNVNIQLYTTRWEPKQADRVDQLSAQLVCAR